MREPQSTIPAPDPTETQLPPVEQDTGRYNDDAALARAYVAACNARDEFERWVRYLAGKLNGVEVDIAQSQAFDERVDARLGRIESAVGDLLTISRRNEANIGFLVDQYRSHGHRLSAIESNPRLSLVPNNTDELAIAAQEGE